MSKWRAARVAGSLLLVEKQISATTRLTLVLYYQLKYLLPKITGIRAMRNISPLSSDPLFTPSSDGNARIRSAGFRRWIVLSFINPTANFMLLIDHVDA